MPSNTSSNTTTGKWFGGTTSKRATRAAAFALVAALSAAACDATGDGSAQQAFRCAANPQSPNVPALLANAVDVKWDGAENEYVGKSRINQDDPLEKLELEPYSLNMVHVEHGDREAGWVYDQCFQNYPLWKTVEVDFKKHRNAKQINLPSTVKVDQYKPKTVTVAPAPQTSTGRAPARNNNQNPAPAQSPAKVQTPAAPVVKPTK